jgi:hypothetical protein
MIHGRRSPPSRYGIPPKIGSHSAGCAILTLGVADPAVIRPRSTWPGEHGKAIAVRTCPSRSGNRCARHGRTPLGARRPRAPVPRPMGRRWQRVARGARAWDPPASASAQARLLRAASGAADHRLGAAGCFGEVLLAGQQESASERSPCSHMGSSRPPVAVAARRAHVSPEPSVPPFTLKPCFFQFSTTSAKFSSAPSISSSCIATNMSSPIK